MHLNFVASVDRAYFYVAPVLIGRWGRDFLHPSRRTWGLDHPTPSSAEDKERVELYLDTLVGLFLLFACAAHGVSGRDLSGSYGIDPSVCIHLPRIQNK
jgi:hypothetical protein